MLLFAAAAYVAWFTGRYIYTDRRFSLYTLSTLALFWTEFLALDGFRLTGSAHLLALAATTLAITSTSRLVRVDDEASRALHLAGALLSLLLAVASFGSARSFRLHCTAEGGTRLPGSLLCASQYAALLREIGAGSLAHLPPSLIAGISGRTQ